MSGPRETALTYVTRLSNKAFAEFFYEAVRGRVTSDAEEWNGHFVLADAEQVTANEPWDIDFIGIHDSEQYESWDDNAPICQSGACQTCGCRVRSWAKQAVCPICEQSVFCT
jgi:hypothetical protein